MSFRRNRNRRDRWDDYRERRRAVVAGTGLPEWLFKNEQSLSEYLTVGFVVDASDVPTIESLDEEQYERLFDFVTSWFDYRAAEFTALDNVALTVKMRHRMRLDVVAPWR